jgi:hypothetical protein
VLSKNSLPFIRDLTPESVYDACQQAKCHQLSYPISTSASKAPLELTFYDVWGQRAILLANSNTSSVLLMIIANLPRFTYLSTSLKSIKKFVIFKILLSGSLTGKSSSFNLTGAEYQKLNTFF